MSRDLGSRRPGESLRSDPYRTAAHEKGAEGEAYVGLLLDRLPRETWTVLHSVPVDGIGDIDHLVIGPPGVIAINSKNHSGKAVRVEGDHIRVGSRDVGYAQAARRHRLVVGQLLERAGAPAAPIHTMVAFVVDDASRLVVVTEPPGVEVCWADDLVRRLKALPVEISRGTAREISKVANRPSTWGRTVPSPGVRRSAFVGAPSRVSPGRSVGRLSSKRPGIRPPMQPSARAIAWAGGSLALLVLLSTCGPMLTWRGAGSSPESAVPPAEDSAGIASSWPAPAAEGLSVPDPPAFAYPLYSDDPLTRYLEASLASGMADVDLRPWVHSGSTLDDVEAAIAEVSVRSPYVYIDAWDLEIDTLRPRYRYDSFEIPTEQIRAALGIAQASDEIRAMGMTDASDVAIAIHDWLAESATYDADLAATYSDGSIAADDDAVDAASAFRAFGTVGLGYARAFASIAHELGIHAEVVTGRLDAMRHAWNTVVINGEVLSVDVATDDARGGEPSSDRLLMAGERARELGYHPDAVPRP